MLQHKTQTMVIKLIIVLAVLAGLLMVKVLWGQNEKIVSLELDKKTYELMLDSQQKGLDAKSRVINSMEEELNALEFRFDKIALRSQNRLKKLSKLVSIIRAKNSIIRRSHQRDFETGKLLKAGIHAKKK